MRIPRHPCLTFKEIKEGPKSECPLNSTLFLSRGLDAISILVESGILTSNTPILIPSYICNSVIDRLLKNGIPLLYYSVENNFSVNPFKIDGYATKQARAFFIIHYFGIVQNMEAIKEFCDERKILLIEDCAHSFLSEYGGTSIGSWGDFSFFSLRKMVPVPNGGMLKVNNNKYEIKLGYLRHSAFSKDLKWLLKNLVTYFEFKTGITVRRPSSLNVISENSVESMRNEVQGISRVTEILFGRFNLYEIRKRRLQNFNYLASVLKDIKGLSLPFDALREGPSPMALPVVLVNGGNKRFCSAMNQVGIDVYPWPWLSGEMCRQKIKPVLQAIELSEKVVLFPIHQNLDRSHLDYMAAHTKALLQ